MFPSLLLQEKLFRYFSILSNSVKHKEGVIPEFFVSLHCIPVSDTPVLVIKPYLGEGQCLKAQKRPLIRNELVAFIFLFIWGSLFTYPFLLFVDEEILYLIE